MAAPSDPPKPTLSDRWFAFRNRTLADPGFQRRAATFPLSRAIAARRAQGLFDLCAGFVYSQVLVACARLKLFEALRDGPLSLDTIATRVGLRPPALESLLVATQSLRLVERRPGDLYGLGPHGAAYLGNPAIGAMLEHHALLYRDLADPVALLKGETSHTALSDFWPYASAKEGQDITPEAVAPYGELMSQTQSLIADDILEAFPLTGRRRLVDVGGGEGAFLIAAGRRYPDLELVLFDLPAVAERGAARLRQAHLHNHVESIGGDFRHEPLPAGADAISLVRVVHDHDDATAQALLAAACAALRPGGILLLAEPIADAGETASVAAYFAFYLLAMGRGRPRSTAELETLLYDAGFARVRRVATGRPVLTSLIVAQKSAGPANRGGL